MKSLIAAVIVVLGLFERGATAETYDVFSSAIPKGAVAKPQSGRFQFEKASKKSFCVFALYPATDSSGVSSDDFDADWRDLVQGIAPGLVAKKSAAKQGEWSGYRGDGTALIDKNSVVFQLTTLTLQSKKLAVFEMGTVNACQSIRTLWWKSAKLTGAAAGVASSAKQSPATESTPPAENQNATAARSSLIGKWTTSRAIVASYVNPSGSYVGDASSANTSTYRFDSKGNFEHLFAYTKSSRTDTFASRGTYSLKNGVITLAPSFFEHKRNAKPVADNDPRNLATYQMTFVFDRDTETNLEGLKFSGIGGHTVVDDLHVFAGR